MTAISKSGRTVAVHDVYLCPDVCLDEPHAQSNKEILFKMMDENQISLHSLNSLAYIFRNNNGIFRIDDDETSVKDEASVEDEETVNNFTCCEIKLLNGEHIRFMTYF